MKSPTMLKLLFNIFLSTTLMLGGAGSKAFASTLPNEAQEQFRLDFETQSGSKSVEVETLTVDSVKEAAEKITQILSQNDDRTIVSSAKPEVLEAAAHFPKRVALLPIAEAVRFTKDKINGANEILRTARQNLVTTWREDKIGLGIFTYKVGSDVIRWVHADDLSSFAKTSGVLYLVLSSALFALDKKSWPKLTEPIEKRWNKLLKFSEKPEERTNGQRLTLSYLSSATATTLINLGFIPILSADRIAAGNASSMLMPLAMGLVTTASTFSWFEFLRAIDETKQPRARKIAQGLVNMRTLVIATTASTVMLLNAHEHGATPWIWLTAAGAGGIPLMLNAQKVADWLERSPTINKVAKAFQAVQRKKAAVAAAARSLVRKVAPPTASPAMACKDVFVRM